MFLLESSLASSSSLAPYGLRLYSSHPPTALPPAFEIQVSDRAVGDLERFSLGLPKAVGGFYWLDVGFSFQGSAIYSISEVNGPDSARPNTYWEHDDALAICSTKADGDFTFAFLVEMGVVPPLEGSIYAFDLSGYGTTGLEIAQVSCQGFIFQAADGDPQPGEWTFSDNTLQVQTDLTNRLQTILSVVAMKPVALEEAECGWAFFEVKQGLIFERIEYLGRVLCQAQNPRHPKSGEFIVSGPFLWIFLPLSVSRSLSPAQPQSATGSQYVGQIPYSNG